MESIFEKLEQNIFREMCEKAREYTSAIFKEYDDEIFRCRDKKRFYVVGKEKTAVKTIYGEVEYTRRRYRERTESGDVGELYLLDHVLGVFGVGKISKTLAQEIAISATEQSFRRTADSITRTTGQRISHSAVWNVVQALGERVQERESIGVRRMKDDMLQGKEEVPVLFEEIDGVYLSIQGKDRKKKHKRAQEMKVAVAYKGCVQENGRTKLVGKVAVAGFYSTGDFHAVRESEIRRKYNTDEVLLRLLNGDGAMWIRNVIDPDTVYQLDPFHIQQEITRSIAHKPAAAQVRKYLSEHRLEACFEYIETYRDSVSGKDRDNAERLLQYLRNNKDGLIPYYERGIFIPKPPDGIIYRNMGTQENHNCTIITHRMKGRRASWSISGANNMAKLLTERENGTLPETVDAYISRTQSERLPETVNVSLPVLSAAKAPGADGKGNSIMLGVHLPLSDWKRTVNTKAILAAAEIKGILQ